MIEVIIKVSDAERSLIEKTLVPGPFLMDVEDAILKPLLDGALHRFATKPDDVIIKTKMTV